MIKLCLLLIATLSGCGPSSEWKKEAISTGVTSFDSKKFIHEDPLSPLRFEILFVEGESVAHLSLMRYQFSGARAAAVSIEIRGEKSEVILPILEGKMRIRFPAELTEKIIHALQEGEKVVIIVDGLEAVLKPSKDFFPL